MDDHLAVAHVVFFDLRALAHAAQLHERVPRVRLVLGAHDVLVVAGGNQPELHHVRIGDEVERDEIGARLLDRRELLLERGLRHAPQRLGDQARAVADDLVQVGRQLARRTRPSASPARPPPRPS